MVEIIKKEVGMRIKHIRESYNDNLREFGNRIKAKIMENSGKEDAPSESIIFRWEKGTSIPSGDRLKALADLGNISVDELLYGFIETSVSFINDKTKLLYDLTKEINSLQLEIAKTENDNKKEEIVKHHLINNFYLAINDIEAHINAIQKDNCQPIYLFRDVIYILVPLAELKEEDISLTINIYDNVTVTKYFDADLEIIYKNEILSTKDLLTVIKKYHGTNIEIRLTKKKWHFIELSKQEI